MKQRKRMRLFTELLTGSIVGLVFAALIFLGTWIVQAIIGEQKESALIAWTVFVIGPLSGAAVAAIYYALSRAIGSKDLKVFCFLICISLGSASVVLLDLGNRSLTPWSIYALALLNGTLLIPVLRQVAKRESEPDKRGSYHSLDPDRRN